MSFTQGASLRQPSTSTSTAQRNAFPSMTRGLAHRKGLGAEPKAGQAAIFWLGRPPKSGGRLLIGPDQGILRQQKEQYSDWPREGNQQGQERG